MSKKKQVTGKKLKKVLSDLLKITQQGWTKSKVVGPVKLKDGSKAYVIIGVQPDPTPYI